MFNTNGIGSSTPVGFQALMANTTGFNNAAFGVLPSKPTPAETTTQPSVI